MDRCQLSESDREKFGMLMAMGIGLMACGKKCGESKLKCLLPVGHEGPCVMHCSGFGVKSSAWHNPKCLCHLYPGLYDRNWGSICS